MYRLRDLEFNLNIIIKRTNKRSYIRVKPDRLVEITTPVRLKESELAIMLDKAYPFIKKSLLRLRPDEVESIIHYLGKPYSLKIIASSIDRVELKASLLYVYTSNTSPEHIRFIIYKLLYGEGLMRVINENIATIRAKLKISFPIRVELKDVKTYYGKCYFNEHRIVFSYMLAKYEQAYIISVIYHELAHFYFHDHQAGFYKLLEEAYPGYKATQHALRMTKYNDIY